MAGAASMPMVIPSVPNSSRFLREPRRVASGAFALVCEFRGAWSGGRITSNVARLKNCHSPRICHPIQLGVSRSHRRETPRSPWLRPMLCVKVTRVLGLRSPTRNKPTIQAEVRQ